MRCLATCQSQTELTYGLLVMLLFSYFSFLWVLQVSVTKEGPPRAKGHLSCGETSLTRGGRPQGVVSPLPGWPMLGIPQARWSCSTLQLPWPHPCGWQEGFAQEWREGVKLDPSWECCPGELLGKGHRKWELYLKKDLVLWAEKWAVAGAGKPRWHLHSMNCLWAWTLCSLIKIRN